METLTGNLHSPLLWVPRAYRSKAGTSPRGDGALLFYGTYVLANALGIKIRRGTPALLVLPRAHGRSHDLI